MRRAVMLLFAPALDRAAGRASAPVTPARSSTTPPSRPPAWACSQAGTATMATWDVRRLDTGGLTVEDPLGWTLLTTSSARMLRCSQPGGDEALRAGIEHADGADRRRALPCRAPTASSPTVGQIPQDGADQLRFKARAAGTDMWPCGAAVPSAHRDVDHFVVEDGLTPAQVYVNEGAVPKDDQLHEL